MPRRIVHEADAAAPCEIGTVTDARRTVIDRCGGDAERIEIVERSDAGTFESDRGIRKDDAAYATFGGAITAIQAAV